MTRHKKTRLVVATGVALAGLLATVTAVLVLPRGTGTAGAEEVRSPAAAAEASAPEPVFKPGIPGLEVADVRDHKALWRDFEELQRFERVDRISIAEYRSQAIEKTAGFLELRGAASDEFAAAAYGAIATIRESFRNWRRTSGDAKVEEARFYSDMDGAVRRVASLLTNEPRHQLFAPDCKAWLLRLAFGPKEAKEAAEAKQRSKRT